MLDPWALSVKKLKKLTALSLYQRADLRHAAAIHATSELEKRSIRAQGLGQSVIVSPNGVDFPEKMPPRISNGRVRTAIFLSRLHPGKGLLSLVEAWAQVRPQGWAMNIVGPDTYGHKAEVVKRLEHFGIQDQWHFVDMIDDVEKWKAYRSADLLIHPSVSENFGITIAEGLAAGLPVITTKGTPWEELVTRDCGWWIDVGVESLAQALKTALRISSVDMEKMGRNGQSLIKEKYTWAAAARLMIAGYQELLGAGVSTV